MGNPLNNFKKRFMDFLYKGAIAGNPEWYNQAVGMGSSIDEKQDPMSPEAANAADKVKEVGMLGAYEVAPVVTGLAGATKGAVDASKNGLNWQNGLEIGLNLLPGAIKGSKAALRNPHIVGKADALARQINDMTKEVKLTPTVDTNVGWGPAQTLKAKPTIIRSEPYNRIAPSDGRTNRAVNYYYSDRPNQYFQLISDTEPGNYSIHFKTDRGALSHDEVQGIIDRIANDLPEGSNIATWGSVSKGGFSGLNRFRQAGFVPSGQYRKLGLKQSTPQQYVVDKYGVTPNTDGTVNWPVLTKPKVEPKPVQLHVVGQPEKVVNTENPNLLKAIQEKFAKDYGEPVTWLKEGLPYDGGGIYQVRVIGTKPLGPTAKTMSGLMDSVIGQKYAGQDWTAYAKATDGVKKGGTLLYIPENQALVDSRIGGFAETNGNRFVETPVTHKWLDKEKFLGTEVHEGVSHPTDDAVASLTKDGKRVDELYRELSNPAGVGDEANALGLLESENSPNWVEARATRWEVAQKMLMDEAKSRGISVEALVKEDPMIMQKLANKVGPNELNDLLTNVGTKYGVDYSTYLNLMPTRKAQAVYAGKWREALKWLPGVAAVPFIPIMKKESTE